MNPLMKLDRIVRTSGWYWAQIWLLLTTFALCLVSLWLMFFTDAPRGTSYLLTLIGVGLLILVFAMKLTNRWLARKAALRQMGDR